MGLDELFRLLDVAVEDRVECANLLSESTRSADVDHAIETLTARLGSYSQDPLGAITQDPLVWLTAFLRLTPILVNWHRRLGVSLEVTRATFADVGRNITIHRRAHGGFGLETWDWLIPHYTGMMFALGRLNYMLHPTKETVDGVMVAGDWVPGIHIPESGPLTPQAVDDSLVQARAFFSTHFPDKPVAAAACVSWLLDPYLVEHLPEDTNIVSFVCRFTALGRPYDDATAALFFMFRTRDLRKLPDLPRDSTLRRLVLDRALTGDPWQIGSGYLRL
ncbi:acyltransferase domain-containing protein [Frigoribacterium sp. CG_9.8]|uniref:acyltransferase domain-containing protein n=1 Tax=Frigoribacterium sp. CG_9.8 TaxID=2787733 RepID=UPI0018C9FC62|nr:acyltransferase domain-containing protein [Frigoribacterium sp. CG_9.8]MBG6107397.1 hypothetical protein [Frigoribacterium sp. CG_9.8]